MRLTALLAIVLATTACSGGSSGATSAGSGPSAPTATVLPASGTVKLSDGITYTVAAPGATLRSEEHTSELQSQFHLVCRLLLEKKKKNITIDTTHINTTIQTA